MAKKQRDRKQTGSGGSAETTREIPPELYINRELSWLEFNRRVLQEVGGAATPLLERLKFAGIFASNLDEFFMIRVAGVKRKVVAGIGDPGPDGRTPLQQLAAIHQLSQELLAQHATIVHQELLPALARHGIAVVPFSELRRDEQKALTAVFEREIFPVLTPQAVDRGRRFPHISNDSLNLMAVLRSGQGSRFARVKVPALLPRLVPVPSSKPLARSGNVLATEARRAARAQETVRFTWLEQVIRANLDRLFPGSEVVGAYPFHLLRDSDVEPDEDEDDASDLMDLMRETLSQRPFGTVVRIDIDRSMPEVVRDWLLDQLRASERDLYEVTGPLNLEDLAELATLDRPDLKDPPFHPVPIGVPPRDVTLDGESDVPDIFAILRQRDILVHHPYQSFNAIVDFVRAASTDPDVVAIKQTLYRIGKDSPLIPALIEARDDDTQVAVLVELKARFDEESNISWAQTLERHGVHVAYGVSGLKTHCKLTLVVRREADGLHRYVHVSTGNYNANTARVYEDIGLLSARADLASDVSELFNELTGFAEQGSYRKIWVAPVGMRQRFVELIHREIETHQRHGKGHILFKFNSLVDRDVIRALYAASRAGIKIDLIVRGICCLRPGVPGWSETIRVVSVVGRFLEHSRIYAFRNGGAWEVYIGSADVMERNFDHRVEVMTPVEDATLAAHLREAVMPAYLRDTVNARELQSDGSYRRIAPEKGAEPFDVQMWLMDYYRKGPIGGPLVPARPQPATTRLLQRTSAPGSS